VKPGRRSTKAAAARGGSSKAIIALAVLGGIVLLYGWNAMFLAPRDKDRAAVETELATARQEEQDLRHNMAELRKLAADTKTKEAELAGLGRLVPATPDVAGAIVALDDTAKAAQVGMASFVPAPPAATAGGGPATIGVSMTISGTFDQLYDYLHRLETLDRLVVVDSLQLSGSAGAASAPTSGPPKLSAEIKARMFAAGGATAAPGSLAAVTPAGGGAGGKAPADDPTKLAKAGG